MVLNRVGDEVLEHLAEALRARPEARHLPSSLDDEAFGEGELVDGGVEQLPDVRLLHRPVHATHARQLEQADEHGVHVPDPAPQQREVLRGVRGELVVGVLHRPLGEARGRAQRRAQIVRDDVEQLVEQRLERVALATQRLELGGEVGVVAHLVGRGMMRRWPMRMGRPRVSPLRSRIACTFTP